MATNPTTENHPDEFDTLLAQSIEKSNLKEGSVIKGVITEIDDDAVVVDVRGKTEGRIPKREFVAFQRDGKEFTEGDEVEVILDALDVYLKEVSEKNFKGTKKPKDEIANNYSRILYFQAERIRRDLHNILTERGYEESQAELHKETDKEICGEN